MKNLSLSQKQIILGGLLGDSSFNKKTQYVTFSQCEKQEEYLRWKYNYFKIDNNIKSVYNNIGSKKYLRYYFNLYRKDMDDDFVSFLFNNLYTNDGRKKISLKYLNQLDELGLAIWWLDDGSLCLSKGNRWGKLSTHCFNYEEHLILQKYFKEKWDIEFQIKIEKNKYFFLKLNATELKKFIKIIYKNVLEIPEMLYKIDMDYTYRKSIGEDFEEIYQEIKNRRIYI